MRELRSCDFCGADAVGTFAVVPPELEPTEAEQRRVVLCPDCKERLETLVEPLLARAGAGDADGRSIGGTDADGPDREGGTVVASADESTGKRRRTSSPNATVSEAGGASDDRDTGADGGAGPGSDGRSDDTADTVGSDEDGSGDETDGRGEPAGDDGTAGHDDTADDAETGSADDTAGGDDDGTSSDGTGSGPTGGLEGGITFERSAASGSGNKPPKGYGKVLRLLRNREFPMQRSAVENLAAGAYDLESHEVDAIIEHAVQRGEFVEKNGKLRRPHDA